MEPTLKQTVNERARTLRSFSSDERIRFEGAVEQATQHLGVLRELVRAVERQRAEELEGPVSRWIGWPADFDCEELGEARTLEGQLTRELDQLGAKPSASPALRIQSLLEGGVIKWPPRHTWRKRLEKTGSWLTIGNRSFNLNRVEFTRITYDTVRVGTETIDVTLLRQVGVAVPPFISDYVPPKPEARTPQSKGVTPQIDSLPTSPVSLPRSVWAVWTALISVAGLLMAISHPGSVGFEISKIVLDACGIYALIYLASKHGSR